MQAVPLLLLLISPALALTHPLNDDVFSEAGRPLQEQEAEELISRLIREQQLAHGGNDDAGEVDVQMHSVSEGETEPELPAKEGPPSAPIKKGQSEYVTFVEPAVVQSERRMDMPEMAMKRSQEQAHDSGRSGRGMTGMNSMIFLSVATVCAVATVTGMVVGGVFWHRLHKQHLAAQEAEYPQYGVSGPSKEKKSKRQNGDESMAYKAQLHHYQQTKQKIISGEESGVGGARHHESEESEGEGDDGEDYSVYECPGLAPTGDIEVQNPMFDNSASMKESTPREGD